MSWSEIDTTQSIQRDAEGNMRAVRIFRVWGNYPRTMILTDPTAILNTSGIGLPDYGESWMGMTLDAYEVNPLGSIWDVNALYSNNRRFVGWNGNYRNDENFKSWSGGTSQYTVRFPLARYKGQKIYVANPSGPPTERVIESWTFDTEQTECKRIIIRREVVIDTAVGLAPGGNNYPVIPYNTPQRVEDHMRASEEQHGKIHKIRGRWYKYNGADWYQTGKTQWTFEHKWDRDAGLPRNPPPPIYGPPNNRIVYPSDRPETEIKVPWLSGDKLWIVPPYHTVVVVPNPAGFPSDPAAIPLFRFSSVPDNSDPMGWATLPGVVE